MPVTLSALVIKGAGGATVTITFAVPVPLAFAALTLAEKVPDVVGVPEISPVPALKLSPPGRPLAP